MRLSSTCWLPIPAALQRRVARGLRLLLCALLVFGLFPGSEEVVETVVHLVHDGHLPHSDAHAEVAVTEDCGDSDEHGCTPLAHSCECCASLSALPPSTFGAPLHFVLVDEEQARPHSERGPPNPGMKPFLRPPIA